MKFLSFKSKSQYRPPSYVAIAAMGAKCFLKYLFVVFTIKASFEIFLKKIVASFNHFDPNINLFCLGKGKYPKNFTCLFITF